MASLEWSADALNVIGEFYGAETVVYVEGDDDVPFWTSIFKKVSQDRFSVQPLGGSEEVEKYISRIEEDDVRIFVARDSDYIGLGGKGSFHPRVIYSYGYSIENTIYTADIVSKIAGICHRNVDPGQQAVEDWLADSFKLISPLVHLDAASTLHSVGVKVLGSNCAMFMESSRSPIFSKTKIDKFKSNVASKISEALVQDVSSKMSKYSAKGVCMIRGHFLVSAILRYIANHAKKNVSYETLYTSAMSTFDQLIGPKHPHYRYYENSISNAVKSL
ncbi:DUF4435 domain-containing protein [Xanthomonas arboricola]|uniref:DUF4435 domain-containing protein n=1 Tax=Xanthomonas arboricola TaxID=56448 RepID=UPI000C83C4FA|nr:DUF4435 domain-containing protein [Xanthomonas arboricola]PPU26847.1 hypothetical protein XarCFBP6762_10935 [Xanthomonas arboricola]SOT93206.1 hypothetical protein CFBP6762_00079 [Xanthomonas arboricola pv. fragariae]